MDRTERFYRIDQLLNDRKVVPFSTLVEKLEVSRATLKRDLEYMRNRLNAPIVWDREEGGYRFAGHEGGAAQYELPGMWFNGAGGACAADHAAPAHGNLDPAACSAPHIAPLLARLRALLGTADDTTEEIHKRIRILGMASRRMALDHFAVVGSALLRRKRLLINTYVRRRATRPSSARCRRSAWCITATTGTSTPGATCATTCAASRWIPSADAEIIEQPARNVPEKTLDSCSAPATASSPGNGKSPGPSCASRRSGRAGWALEQWHPRQKASFDKDGSYLLEVPSPTAAN
jgi:hypothetical protein